MERWKTGRWNVLTGVAEIGAAIWLTVGQNRTPIRTPVICCPNRTPLLIDVNPYDYKGLRVETSGIEPPTSWLQTRRSPN